MERLVKERMVFDHVQVQTRKKKEALRLIFVQKKAEYMQENCWKLLKKENIWILPAAEKELRCPMPGSAE